MLSAFELLQEPWVFTKLDHHNSYHLVLIHGGHEWRATFNSHSSHYDGLLMSFLLTNAPALQTLVKDILNLLENCFFCQSWKVWVSSVYIVQRFKDSLCPNGDRHGKEKWPVPTTSWNLLWFLRIASFYDHFVHNYSIVPAPLNTPTSAKLPFQWNQAMDWVFIHLKAMLILALTAPDHMQQTAIEVDASKTVLALIKGGAGSLCAFFLCLSPTKQNYKISNREFLVVKLALEEYH